jgi:AcrR family transcriptional regulator
MKKEAIKQAALQILAVKGYHETSIQDIADAVGIKKPTIYSHFRSKSDLYLVILEEQFMLIRQSMLKVIEDSREQSIECILLNLLYAFIHSSTREGLLLWRNAMNMVAGGLSDEVRDAVRKILQRTGEESFHDVAAVISSKAPRISRERVLPFITSYQFFIQSFIGWMTINTHLPKAEMEDKARLLWHGFWYGNKIE